jgi:hypothetical protein
MLCPSSIPNEFYLGDKPGTIQYNKDQNDIINSVKDIQSFNNGWELCDHSPENIDRIMPHTQKIRHFKILLCMKKELPNGTIWLKVGMENKKSKKIALLTSTNRKQLLKRPIKTFDSNWFVGHYRMSAPTYFWIELANRIKY